MSNADKLKQALSKEAKEQGIEPLYFFFAFKEGDDTRFVSSTIGKTEMHMIIGMLERAKHDFLKRIERQPKE